MSFVEIQKFASLPKKIEKFFFILVFGIPVLSCSLNSQTLTVYLTESMWVAPIEEWSFEKGINVRYYFMESGKPWPTQYPYPDILFGPHLSFWKDQYQDLLPLIKNQSEGDQIKFYLGTQEDQATLSILNLTLVPAVVLYPKLPQSKAVMDWNELLKVPPRTRTGLGFSPWWVGELIPSVLNQLGAEPVEWLAMTRDTLKERDLNFLSQISGIIPFIELRDGRIAAWVLPYNRLKQLETRELNDFSWSYLSVDDSLLLYPNGSQVALTKKAGALAKDLFAWLIKKNSIQKILVHSPSRRTQFQWSNKVGDLSSFENLSTEVKFLPIVEGPSLSDVQNLAKGVIDWKEFKLKFLLTD